MADLTEAFINEFYASRRANNADACFGYYAPTARIHIAGDEANSPIPMDESGEALHGQLDALIGTWHWKEQRIVNVVLGGDRAAVHYMLDVTHTGWGKSITTEICDLLTVVDGKETELVEFVDTATVERISG